MNMLAHKSSLLLFEKWKKMSQISVLIMLSRWQQAFMCRGSVPAFFLLYVNSDSRLIVMASAEEQSEKCCVEDRTTKRMKTECMRRRDIQRWILRKGREEIASDLQGFLGRCVLETAHSSFECISRGLFSHSRQHLRNMFVCSSSMGNTVEGLVTSVLMKIYLFLPESRKPLANGLRSIFSRVIWQHKKEEIKRSESYTKDKIIINPHRLSQKTSKSFWTLARGRFHIC